MRGIECRIAALEVKASTVDASLRLVFIGAGETEAEALKRTGHPPDVDVMCVVFVSPTDARL